MHYLINFTFISRIALALYKPPKKLDSRPKMPGKMWICAENSGIFMDILFYWGCIRR
jgi:hypothetical protein